VVEGTEQQRLVAAFRSPQLYMADGHHRYETALAYRDERRWARSALPATEEATMTADASRPPTGDPAFDFAMVLLVDAWDPGLVVLPTHRLVRGVDPAMIQGLDGALPGLFEMERLALDGRSLTDSARLLLQRMQELSCGGPTFGIYRPRPFGAAVLRLRTLPESKPGSRPLLDVDVLHEMLMAPLMGIGPAHLKAETHVAYTRDAVEALAAVDRGDAQVALLLNPTRVEQVLSTARAYGKMPQKSTYFYPKPVTGLVFNPL